MMNGNSKGNRMEIDSNASDDLPNCDALLNLTILDPPKYGWSVLGGIRNVCVPHENARRESTRLEYLAKKEMQQQETKVSVLSPPKASSKQNQPTVTTVASNEDKHHSMNVPIENNTMTNKETEDTQRGNSVNKTQPMKPSTTAATTSNKSKYDFGPQYSVDIQVINKPKSKRKSSKKVSVEVLPFVQQQQEQQQSTICQDITVDPESEQSLTLTQSKGPMETTSVQAVSSISNVEDNDKSLHPRAYHRGIEGEEPRNKISGHLYNDVGITDTNYAWDILPNDCIIPIRIEFPLSEPDVIDHEMAQGKDSSSVKGRSHERRCKSPMLHTQSQLQAKRESIEVDLVTFRDTIQWDLSNPNTPTPMVYATNIGVEFGLPSLRILDLSRSIQNQIDEFIRDYVIYHVPISAKDSYGEKRTKAGLQPVKYKNETKLHGGHCATNVATKFKLFDEVDRCTHALEDSTQEANSAVDSQKSNRKKREDKVIRPEKYDYDVTPVDKIPKHDFSSLGNDIDPLYSEECLRRSKEEVIKIIKILSNGVIGKATECCNRKCHYCRKARNYCIQFPCGIESHVICDFHTSTRLGWRVEDAVDRKLNYCPICAVECTCHSCFTRATELVSLFSKECKQQNLGPKDASFDFISHCSRTLSRLAKKAGVLGTETSQVTKNDSDIQKKSTVQRISLETEEVPKIVPDEFPNELSGTVNLDPSLKDDYNTIFTPQGSTVLETQNVSDNVPHPKVHVGDENIEECIQCMGIGNILCCERCPRSFHAECLPGINEDELPEEWICPRCTDDLSEQDGDIKSGSTVVKKLTEVYGLHNGETGFVDNVTILGQLYEICEGLIKADFGSTFKDPVDLKLVPFYKKYVKRPMDLGTIMSNIRKGIYANYDSAHHKDIDGFETALQMDLIILHVLRDLELIWYNCFKFNRPDSSFYRMGAVMQIRCSVMKRLNINSKLSSFVTQNFQLFVQKCEADLQQSLSNVTEKNWIPPSKYEIHNTATGRGIIGHKRKKPVGIYDPDTKMVVKQYSSINIALSVYDFLVSKNHKSGLKSSNNVVLRHCINTSPNDPSIKLFGYRWMPMENIRSGSFKIDGEVATIVDEANVNNVELNSNSDMNGSGTNTKNDCNSKEKCEISVDNDAGNDENKGIASLNNDIKVSSQFAPLKTHQKEGHCENEIESSSSFLNREADNLSSGNPDSMDITTSQNREPLSSALNTTAYTQTKKRSLEEMNGTQAIICSPIKVTRTKIGSLCENVQYSPRVQMNALSAAKEIRCNEVVTAVDTGIIAIDISSVAIVKEYDNVVSAARNISQEELLKSIQKRILVDNILYIYASEKDEIINAMRKAVQPLDIYKT